MRRVFGAMICGIMMGPAQAFDITAGADCKVTVNGVAADYDFSPNPFERTIGMPYMNGKPYVEKGYLFRDGQVSQPWTWARHAPSPDGDVIDVWPDNSVTWFIKIIQQHPYGDAVANLFHQRVIVGNGPCTEKIP